MNRTKQSKSRCATFDLWETLIFDEPESDEVRGRMRYEGVQTVLQERGVKLASADLKRAYEESGAKLQEVWDRNEEVPIIDQIRLMIALAASRPIAVDPEWIEPLEAAYVDPILSIPPKLSTEAFAVLEAVRDRGYKIGLISNTGRSPGVALRRLLENCGVSKFFDATIFSNEVNRRKPDRTIFDTAAQSLGAENGAIAHVGDNPVADFWGARNAGMCAFLLDQPHPYSSQWPAHSLFALGRRHQHRSGSEVPPNWRVKSLLEIPGRLDTLFLNDRFDHG